MAAIQKKSAPETFKDNTFVVFSQGYLIEQVKAEIKKKQYGSTVGNQPKVLDIGCYNGRLFAFMGQSQCYVEYEGVDYMQKYLDMSNTKSSKRYNIQQCDVTNGLPFPDNHFEFVVSSEVFEHIESKHYPFLLKEIHRVLKDDAVAILGFPMNTLSNTYHTVENELKSLGHVDFPVHETFIKTGEDVGLKFELFDSSFTTSSSWRISKKRKQTEEHKRIRRMLGSDVARAIAMIVDEDHTGGGFYTFRKT